MGTSRNVTSVAIPSRCLLGEGPLWDFQRKTLFWTDIERGELHAWHEPSNKVRKIYEGPAVGGFTLEIDGALALFRVNDITRFEPETGRLQTRTFSDEGMRRFNDVVADAHGRVFVGTIGKNETSGGVFRFDPNGVSRLLFRGTGVSNGMGFSPDNRTFYWTCSTSGKIFKFDYDEATGDIFNQRVFYECDGNEGVPDGLCVDLNGDVWSARWEGACITRHSGASGGILEKIPVPADRVTSCCFGGQPNTLFVTTARKPDESQSSEAGGVFSVSVNAEGLPRSRSRMFPALSA